MRIQVLVPTWCITLLAMAAPAGAQEPSPRTPASLTCASTSGQRQVCPADTSSGVVLVRSTGTTACLLGKTWGYDDAGVWVADGCSDAGNSVHAQKAIRDIVKALNANPHAVAVPTTTTLSR